MVRLIGNIETEFKCHRKSFFSPVLSKKAQFFPGEQVECIRFLIRAQEKPFRASILLNRKENYLRSKDNFGLLTYLLI